MGRTALRLTGAAAVAAVAIVAAGCGSSGSPSAASTTTTTSTGTGSNSPARSAFTTCLAQHGVKVTPGAGRPPGGGNGSGRPPGGGAGGGFANLTAAQRQAFTACRSKLPAGAGPRGGGPGGNQSNPAFAKYTACLKQHGVTFGASNNQAAFAKAQTACAKYRPVAGGAAQ